MSTGNGRPATHPTVQPGMVVDQLLELTTILTRLPPTTDTADYATDLAAALQPYLAHGRHLLTTET